MSPPPIRPVDVAGIPPELAALPQWLGWKWEWDGKKWTKVPYDANTGRHASSTNPVTWASFEVAVTFMNSERLPGIGFVVTRDDPYVGVDLDNCRNPETGAIDAWAQQIVDDFDSYAEITPSETGLRIWITTHSRLLPGGESGRRKGSIEIYVADRYFTVTGHRLERTSS